MISHGHSCASRESLAATNFNDHGCRGPQSYNSQDSARSSVAQSRKSHNDVCSIVDCRMMFAQLGTRQQDKCADKKTKIHFVQPSLLCQCRQQSKKIFFQMLE